MVAGLLSVVFTATGLLALTVLGMSARRYGAAARGLRAEFAACEQWREVRVRISEVQVRPTATVLRPAFTAAARRPSGQAALPAAA